MAYVYRHIRLDKNEPFYIGVSLSKNRGYKRAYDTKFRNRHWSSVFNKTAIEVEILMDDLNDEEAKAKEMEFISLYKRIADGGTLVNLTIGGFKNPKLSERNKSGIWTGKKHTDATKLKMSQSGKGLIRNYTNEGIESRKIKMSKKYSGVNNPRYKGIIYAYDKDGQFIGEFETAKEISNILGTNVVTLISSITKERKTADGILFTRRKLH